MFKKYLVAMLAGLLFAAGLVVSGMTQPAKVLAFLNLAGIADAARFGAWDASLAFVMGGALGVTLLAFSITPRPGNTPWLAPAFKLPTRRDIDARLVLGAALFGIGWGLAGYCPGARTGQPANGCNRRAYFCSSAGSGHVGCTPNPTLK